MTSIPTARASSFRADTSWSVWSSSRCGIGPTYTACSRACCLGWICNVQTLHSTSERQVIRIEMIYIMHTSWSVRRIYKYVVSLRQLWVFYKKCQLAVRYYCSVATRSSQFCTRKNHSCSRAVWQQYHPDLERLHTAVLTLSRGIVKNPTGMCCAACYWNRKKNSYRLPTTRYRRTD